MRAACRLLSFLVLVGVFVASSREPGQAAASPVAGARIRAAQAAAPPRVWDTFLADVAISRRCVTRAGVPAGDAPGSATFHWERSRLASGWKTTFTLIRREGPQVVGQNVTTGQLADAVAARMEFDGGAAALRLFDRSGRELKLPSPGDVQRALGIALDASPLYQQLRATPGPIVPSNAADDRWIDNFVLPADQRDQRRAELVREFGSSPGRYQGNDRFVRVIGDVMREVLIDPSSVIPVEINIARGGTLETHATFAYSPAPDGSFTRQAVHVERVLPGDAQDRRVTDIAFSNVRFERRGGR